MQSSDCSDELLEEEEVLEGVISPRCSHGSTQDELNLHLSESILSQSHRPNSYRPSEQMSTFSPSHTINRENSGKSHYDNVTCIQETPEYMDESPVIKTKLSKYYENKTNPKMLNHIMPSLPAVNSQSQSSMNEIIPGTDSDMINYLNSEIGVVANKHNNVDLHNTVDLIEFHNEQGISSSCNNYNSNFPPLTGRNTDPNTSQRYSQQFQVSQQYAENQSKYSNNQVVSDIVKDEQVIIMEPIPDEEHPDIKKFFSNDTFLARNLSKSKFSNLGIKDTHKNLKKNILIIKLPILSNIELTDVLKVDKLGDWKVNCRLPLQEQNLRGVIGPVGLDTPVSELLEVLREKNENIKEIKRLTKGKDKTPTLYVMLVIEGSDLPEYAYIYHHQQCYNCQDMGHNAADCRGKTKCVVIK